MTDWIRTCQECGYQQIAKPPETYVDKGHERWRELKCKRCKSMGLDYGRLREEGEQLNQRKGPTNANR